ncbi:class F sortase [Streptomyces pactum]|uniref:Class F sortase n=1 Tax=Streptomyces pactum TaxID=68249 RepID=A0ABS0NRB1_9ACTN|nr:class F sortase [Streptomyces pactum]MBH5337740.1 class F sortase [Streptomyces pactum]
MVEHPPQADAGEPPHRDAAATPPDRRDNSARILRWAAAAALVGALLVYNSVDASPDSPPDKPAASASAKGGGASPAPKPSRGPALPRSAPVRLAVPTVGVDAPFTELTLNASGQLNAPPDDDNNLVGWFREGASPGERGNAIVAGHVDTRTGPAVFWALASIKPGEKVTVTRADGIVATFVVDEVETFDKDHFPDERVYGDTPNAQLRLITCGGSYDRQARDYTANVVVFAHLDSFAWA